MRNKKYIWIFTYLCFMMVGFLCGFFLYEPDSYKRLNNYIHPYHEYSYVDLTGDTTLYNKIVEDRRKKTPSHPDYFDLSISIAAKFDYAPGYYNAYLALHDLYKYNHFTMGKNVRRLMYSYLQLAIENKDSRVTEDDLRSYREEQGGVSYNHISGK